MRPSILLLSMFASLLPFSSAYACRGIEVVEGKIDALTNGQIKLLENDKSFGLADIILAGAKQNYGQVLDRFLAQGDNVRIEITSTKPDRYNRHLGHVYAKDKWLQKVLLRSGEALIGAGPVKTDCLNSLRKAESHAREGQSGVWSSGVFPLEASDVQSLDAHLGEFVVVRGRVRSIGNRKTTIYLNFGAKWSEDFTIIARKKGKQRFQGTEEYLESKKGTIIRARGILEKSGGPMIRLLNESQVELD